MHARSIDGGPYGVKLFASDISGHEQPLSVDSRTRLNVSSVIQGTQANGDVTDILVGSDRALAVANHEKPQYSGVGLKAVDASGPGYVHDGYRYVATIDLGYTRTAFLDDDQKGIAGMKSCVPLLGADEFINIPAVGVLAYVSSASVLDVNITVNFIFYDDTWTVRYATATLNGQTPVAVVDAFTAQPIPNVYRQLGGVIASSAGGSGKPGHCHVGNLYMYTDINAVTVGVPNDLTDCLSTCTAPDGFFYHGYASAPPGVQMYPSESVQSTSVVGKASEVEIRYWVRNGVGGCWYSPAVFTSSSQQAAGYFHQFAFPDLSNGVTETVSMTTIRRTLGPDDDVRTYSMLGFTLVFPPS